MNIKTAPARKKNKVLYIVCAAIAGIFVLLVCVVFMLTSAPRHYQPLQPKNSNEVSQYLTNYLAPQIHNKSQFNEPFELVVTEQGLNDIVARGRWPIKLNGLTVSGPAVVLSANQITLMATVKYGRIRAVVTIVMSPTIDEGGLLCLNLQNVKAGSVGITALAKELSRKITATYLGKVDGNIWANDMTAALLENKAIDPVFAAYDRQVRLTDIDISNGEAVLHFAPQGKN
jgi:uncharacterized protein YpmS